jgi:nucleoside-diphosphate-sugar epimerase
MKKILITGAGSYIGTAVAAYLAQFPDRYKVDTIDMVDGSWRQADFSGYDTVYHVAGIAHSDTGHVTEERKAFYYKINRDLTVETAQKAKAQGVGQFIFMSSAIVYGDSAPIGKEKLITVKTVESGNYYGVEVLNSGCFSESHKAGNGLSFVRSACKKMNGNFFIEQSLSRTKAVMLFPKSASEAVDTNEDDDVFSLVYNRLSPVCVEMFGMEYH